MWRSDWRPKAQLNAGGDFVDFFPEGSAVDQNLLRQLTIIVGQRV